MRAGLRFSLEWRCGERWQMHCLRGMEQEERFARMVFGVGAEKGLAFCEEDHVHFLQGEIFRNAAWAAVLRVWVLGQFATVELFCRRNGNAVTVDECIQPVGGGAAGGAVELIEAVVDGATFDAACVVDGLNRLGRTAVDGLALLIAKGEPDVPFAKTGGTVVFFAEHLGQGQALGCNQ